MNSLLKQRGLTLIELMVTAAISSVILAGVANLYVNSLSQSKLTANLSAMQESGRFALELMSRDIRMAGFTGCMAYDPLQGTDRVWGMYERGGVAFEDQLLRGIQGWELSGTAYGDVVTLVDENTQRTGTDGGYWATSGDPANVLTENYAEAIANSDIIRLWTAGDVAFDVRAVSYDGSIHIGVDAGHGVMEGEIFMFAECGRIVIAQICDSSETALTISEGSATTCNNDFDMGGGGKDLSDLNSDTNLADDATDSTFPQEAFSYRDATYFVGKRDADPATSPSLFRAVNGTAQEVVEGVENLQILYGVDLDHDEQNLRTPDVYVPADQVDDRWNDVVAVRVSVLIRSFERRADGGTTSGAWSDVFRFNGEEHTATDGYMRQSYSTTISLRNRAVGQVNGLFTSSPI